MFVLVRENSSLHWRQRRGPLTWGEGCYSKEHLKTSWHARDSHFVAELSGFLECLFDWTVWRQRTIVLMTLVILFVIYTSTCQETRKITRSFPINHALQKYQSFPISLPNATHTTITWCAVDTDISLWYSQRANFDDVFHNTQTSLARCVYVPSLLVPN